MILGFSTQINGKPTYFVDKIWSGLIYTKKSNIDICRGQFEKEFEITPYLKPKLHTIREDKNDRWKPGVMIDFFINCRQPNMFRFAPRLPVVSVQKICIEYIFNLSHEKLKQLGQRNDGYYPVVYIDDEWYNSDLQLKQLAENDGFGTVEEFFKYFNEYYQGKIIHWTDLRY